MLFKKKTIEQQVLRCIEQAIEPEIFKKFIDQGLLVIKADTAEINLSLPFYADNWLSRLKQQTNDPLTSIFKQQFSWNVTHKIPCFEHKKVAKTNPNIKNIIAVSSGKGGVGKSTVSVNLALALLQNGAKVGLLDADIYGPSIPTMLGEKNTKSTSADGKLLLPIEAHGVVCNSIGFLIEDKDAMVWRGPMASKALQQVLNETDWPELDYLIVDMPPGTGDIQLTMSQNVPLTSAVVVTTPQDIALIDAQKGVIMFDKVDVNVAGIIENMSVYSCVKCGHEEAIFGTGGGKKLAEQFNLSFLGALPLHIQYREDTDSGCPTVAKNEKTTLVAPYLQLAEDIAINLYKDCQPTIEQIKITEIK
ncbi:iron-sulfur cluster carrier protein ApbC [Psychromonas sp. RZ22]|uniref:iron-sulfur cluster carrier protein ApbC n=1 Tax=Psychromonas algarum TaxID=2555643 RepID=UPI00106764F0|nr:iron-sulfur cluster carrier protein ApbC [Psychromonas sp. RZ22]TEW55364.1 iron-sulfur cluster carrier protein ApbC [Psychromonas sp. RZ22]